jgi:hypothetical protein
MATRMQSHEDVIHATDTALRLVNQALGDLGATDSGAECAASMAEQGARGSRGLRSLASTLLRAHADVVSLLDRCDRASVVVAELEHAAVIADTEARLEQLRSIFEPLVADRTDSRAFARPPLRRR